MSNIELIIEERAANIGNFMVGRLLPFRQKRMVGPFVFIDHMGPTKMSERENMDVLPHPHIGLSTLTYLFEGAMMHRDSLGTAINGNQPGAVNWMTAGKGVVHLKEHLKGYGIPTKACTDYKFGWLYQSISKKQNLLSHTSQKKKFRNGWPMD